MEEIKELLSHPEIIKALGEHGIKEIVMRALTAHYRFRNAQRVFGMVLCLPYFFLAYVATTTPKIDVKDWVWYGCLLCLFVGLSFFFPKQAEPLYNLVLKKFGVHTHETPPVPPVVPPAPPIINNPPING